MVDAAALLFMLLDIYYRGWISIHVPLLDVRHCLGSDMGPSSCMTVVIHRPLPGIGCCGRTTSQSEAEVFGPNRRQAVAGFFAPAAGTAAMTLFSEKLLLLYQPCIFHECCRGGRQWLRDHAAAVHRTLYHSSRHPLAID